MAAYYNENDSYAAQWLRNLIQAGHIAPGEVDERSIDDVRPSDLAGFTQCHFFAGLGAWSYAFRLAGWPDDRPVWSGSCPCQPFSAAGKGKGTADERHLWPAWFRLIRECRPDVIFGEQVEAGIQHGWLDLVQDDLEGEGYAVGAVGLPAASVGAFHIRQRLWFVADADSDRCESRIIGRQTVGYGQAAESDRSAGELGDTSGQGLAQCERIAGIPGKADGRSESKAAIRASLCANPWADCEWIPCRDGKWRPAKSGIPPLAARTPGRVGQLRAYGNCIVPQVAAIFIQAAEGGIDASNT